MLETMTLGRSLSEYSHGTEDCIHGAAACNHSQRCMSGHQLTSSEFIDFNGILQVRHRQCPVPSNEPDRYAALHQDKAIEQQHQEKDQPGQSVCHHESSADGSNQPEQSDGELMCQEKQAPEAEKPVEVHTTLNTLSGIVTHWVWTDGKGFIPLIK